MNRGNCFPQKYEEIMIMYNFSEKTTSNTGKLWFFNSMKLCKILFYETIFHFLWIWFWRAELNLSKHKMSDVYDSEVFVRFDRSVDTKTIMNLYRYKEQRLYWKMPEKIIFSQSEVETKEVIFIARWYQRGYIFISHTW